MKKLWSKFKKWLIKKLGGYTERIVLRPIQAELPRYRTTIKASTITHLARPDKKSVIDFDTEGLYVLMKKIADGLIENRLLTMRYRDDFCLMQREIEATLIVVPPVDTLEPEETYGFYPPSKVFKYWEHTRGGQHETAG